MARKKKEVSVQRVMEELAAIGFSKVTDFLYVENNTLMIRPSEELSAGEKAAIASIERTSNGLKVKFYDKLKALELLGKHMGMFEAKQYEPVHNTNLLEAILAATQKELNTDDIPELQQAADPGNDMVEPSGS